MSDPRWTLGSEFIYHDGKPCSQMFLVKMLNDLDAEIAQLRERKEGEKREGGVRVKGEKEKRKEILTSFNIFWEKYPRKPGGKDYALKCWGKALQKMAADDIIAALESQLPYWAQKERQYIPLPTSWLNKGMWEDDYSQPTAKKTTFGETQEEAEERLRPGVPMPEEAKNLFRELNRRMSLDGKGNR